MDKFELLGYLLQDLRDGHGPDEEDIGPAILRETTRIYELMIRHGHLSREMFDLAGIRVSGTEFSVPSRYSQYQTTNYPITFVVFAGRFAEWLLGKDERKQLDLIDVITMVKECSWLRIKIVPQAHGSLVVVQSQKHSADKLKEQVFVDN